MQKTYMAKSTLNKEKTEYIKVVSTCLKKTKTRILLTKAGLNDFT